MGLTGVATIHMSAFAMFQVVTRIGPKSWARARQRCAEMVDWDPEFRAEALAALDFFKSHFEKRKPWSGWETSTQFATTFFTRFQDGPPEGVRLFRLAQGLAGDPGLRWAIQGLGSADWVHYWAAHFELQLAHRMKAECDSVSFVQPRGDAPAPDLRATPAGRELFVECTAVNDSDNEEKANQVFDAIVLAWFPGPAARGAEVCFAQGVHAADAHRRLPEILRAMEHACETGDEFELYDLASIRALTDSRLSPSTLRGSLAVGDSCHSIDRLLRSIRRKAAHGQLPTTAPGVLAVRTRSLWGQHMDQFDPLARVLRAEVTQALTSATGVGAVLLVEESEVGVVDVPPLGDPRVGCLEIRKGIMRVSLLIPNPNADVPLSDAELSFLDRTCLRW